MTFYKKDYEETQDLLEAPNFVINQNYELRAESYQQHTYPINGWYWFDSKEEAYAFFNITLPINE